MQGQQNIKKICLICFQNRKTCTFDIKISKLKYDMTLSLQILAQKYQKLN